MSLKIESENANWEGEHIEASYEHKFSRFDADTKKVKVTRQNYQFKTQKNTGKVGLLMVGFGGNNGSTILGGILANKHNLTWNTKKG